MKRQRLTAQIINNATLPKKAGKYYWLYLLLGLRKRELLGLEWSELNLTGKPIVIADRVTLPERSLFIPKSKKQVEAGLHPPAAQGGGDFDSTARE